MVTESTLFSPLWLRDMELKNRIVMSPMLMYLAQPDGLVTDLHLAHYGARALGGVGLILTEVIAVQPEGRISDIDLGLWRDEQVAGIRRLAEIAHAAGARFGIQLNHAGRKSNSAGERLAPTAQAYGDSPVPRELTGDEIRELVAAYGASARRAVEAGVDCVEIHASHGYLLHEFLSPRSNRRTDEYGGSAENRMRILLEIVAAVRAAVGDERPIFVRMPAKDVLPDGLTEDDAQELAKRLLETSVDVVDVSTGNLEPGYDAPVYPGYQLEYARRLGELGGHVAAFGSIDSPSLAEYAVSSGAADLVLLGRALLRDPFWPIHAAAAAGVEPELPIPTYARATGPYERGF